jgi:hypothetical protein
MGPMGLKHEVASGRYAILVASAYLHLQEE